MLSREIVIPDAAVLSGTGASCCSLVRRRKLASAKAVTPGVSATLAAVYALARSDGVYR